MDDTAATTSILEQSPVGTLVVNADRHVVYANPAAAALFGVPALAGMQLPSTCSLEGVSRIEHPGASHRVLELSATPMEWATQPATLVNVVDATSLQRVEARLDWHERIRKAVEPLADHAQHGETALQLQRLAARLVCANVQVPFCSVLVYDAAGARLRAVAGCGWRDGDLDQVTIDLETVSPCERTLVEGRPVQVDDWRAQSLYEESGILRRHGVVSSLCVAIPHPSGMKTGPWGVLAACSAEARKFGPADVHVMEQVAGVLSRGMEHTRLMANEYENQMLLQVAGRVARIGGWEIDLLAGRVVWSSEACVIHGLSAERRVMTLTEAGAFTAPEYRSQAEQTMARVFEEGRPFDEEYQVLTATNERAWVRAIGEPVYDADARVVGARGAIQDITQQKHDRERIDFLALHDTLTKLPNRRAFEDRLRQQIASCHHSGAMAALMLLDLDDFKSLNDSMGHRAGDQLLRQVAGRLAGGLRDGDFTARLGGDEFLLIVANLDANGHKAAAQAQALGERVLARLREPYRIGEADYFSTQSMGIVLCGFANDCVEELIKQADMAMYEAKTRGRDRTCVFDPEMQETVKARVALEAEMRAGLSEGQFVAYVQAQVDSNGRVLGAEVLARWKHPRRGLVSPAEFIPVAESTGLIHELGHAMLDQACARLAQWAKQPDRAHLFLAVNVSAQQFHHPTFVDEVLAALSRAGANPQHLVLELTETSVVRNMADTITKMKQLGEHGITFSLDDFGTGYSSLYYLRHLPLAQVKIDQSFVRGISTNPNDATIVRTILALAGAMELEVVAEGVEQPAEREFLAGNGCHIYQGFLFARPQPLEQFEASVLDSPVAVADASQRAVLPPRQSGAPAPRWIGSARRPR